MISTKINSPTETETPITFPIIMEMINPKERKNGRELIVMFTDPDRAIVLHAQNSNRTVGQIIKNDNENERLIPPDENKYWRPFKGELVMKNS